MVTVFLQRRRRELQALLKPLMRDEKFGVLRTNGGWEAVGGAHTAAYNLLDCDKNKCH